MSTNVFRVKRAPKLDTEITVPGDKSISHRAIMLAALSNGMCKITNFLEGEDCLCTARAFQQLGVTIESPEPDLVVVDGSHGKLTAPDQRSIAETQAQRCACSRASLPPNPSPPA